MTEQQRKTLFRRFLAAYRRIDQDARHDAIEAALQAAGYSVRRTPAGRFILSVTMEHTCNPFTDGLNGEN